MADVNEELTGSTTADDPEAADPEFTTFDIASLRRLPFFGGGKDPAKLAPSKGSGRLDEKVEAIGSADESAEIACVGSDDDDDEDMCDG